MASVRLEEAIPMDAQMSDDADEPLRSRLARAGMYVALLAAWVATAGSLYMSEVLGWIPCLWCWYQRIAMYPLAVLLAAGLIWRDLNTPKYALCLAIPGALASTYHILLQKVPAIAALEACVIGVPCSTDYLNLFGFITIPMLALAAFAIVIVASVFALRTQPALARSPLPFFPPAVLVSLVVATTVGLFALSGMMVRGSRQPTAALPTSSADQSAAELYNRACAGCHGPANAGLQLIRAEYLDSHSDLEVMRLIRAGRGVNDPQNFSGSAMPANGGQISLSDEQLLALVRYLRAAR
jgi:disulfide bond formation protein DsbB